MTGPVLQHTLIVALACALAYLRVGRSPALKRLVLPLATAAVAAWLAVLFSSSPGGRLPGFTIGVPLGLATGLALHHFLEFCRGCGVARPLGVSLRHAFDPPASGRHCGHCQGHAAPH